MSRELPTRVCDRGGMAWFEASWRGAELARAEIVTPDRSRLVIAPRSATHPIFGPCDRVLDASGEERGRFGAVAWAEPRRIPPLDRPGALPAGGGTAILNAIARAAPRGRPLRYAGPYPTAALFDSLLDCFRPAAPPAEALATFTDDVEARARTACMDEVAVDFFPAPFERWWQGPVCVQLRDGVEKVYAGGRAYARDAAGPRRVRPRGDHWAAVVEIGGATWAEVAELDRDGRLISGPQPVPAANSPLLGRALPPEVHRAIAAALPPRAPALLRPALARVLADAAIVWGDPGADEAAVSAGTFLVHVGLADALDGAALLEAIARAVEPVAHRVAQARLADSFRDRFA